MQMGRGENNDSTGQSGRSLMFGPRQLREQPEQSERAAAEEPRPRRRTKNAPLVDPQALKPLFAASSPETGDFELGEDARESWISLLQEEARIRLTVSLTDRDQGTLESDEHGTRAYQIEPALLANLIDEAQGRGSAELDSDSPESLTVRRRGGVLRIPLRYKWTYRFVDRDGDSRKTNLRAERDRHGSARALARTHAPLATPVPGTTNKPGRDRRGVRSGARERRLPDRNGPGS